jgi:hypothetical protein
MYYQPRIITPDLQGKGQEKDYFHGRFSCPTSDRWSKSIPKIAKKI